MSDYRAPNKGYIKVKRKYKKSKNLSIILILMLIATISGVILFNYKRKPSKNETSSESNYKTGNHYADNTTSVSEQILSDFEKYESNGIDVEPSIETCLDGMSYWVVFHEGFRNGRLEMSTFNANDNYIVIWNTNLRCINQLGDCNQYCFDNGDWRQIGTYNILTDKALDIVACNVDIYDENNLLIFEKSRQPFEDIDFSQYIN